jgi:hypothetical protein
VSESSRARANSERFWIGWASAATIQSEDRPCSPELALKTVFGRSRKLRPMSALARRPSSHNTEARPATFTRAPSS